MLWTAFLRATVTIRSKESGKCERGEKRALKSYDGQVEPLCKVLLANTTEWDVDRPLTLLFLMALHMKYILCFLNVIHNVSKITED